MKRKGYIGVFIFVIAAGYLIYDGITHFDMDKIRKKNDVVEIPFDPIKWKQKKGDQYAYRFGMFNELLYSKELRQLTKTEILVKLGPPDREADNFLYYTISEKKLGLWTLNQRSMVFKMTEVDSVEWIKLHE